MKTCPRAKNAPNDNFDGGGTEGLVLGEFLIEAVGWSIGLILELLSEGHLDEFAMPMNRDIS